MKLTRDELFQATKEGIKEALLEALDAGDGFTGPIIREPFLDAIEKGVRNCVHIEDLISKLEDISENMNGLFTEIYKYRKDLAAKDPNDTRI
jgi:hypothetical protein